MLVLACIKVSEHMVPRKGAHTWSVATSHSIAASRNALSEYGTIRSVGGNSCK